MPSGGPVSVGHQRYRNWSYRGLENLGFWRFWPIDTFRPMHTQFPYRWWPTDTGPPEGTPGAARDGAARRRGRGVVAHQGEAHTPYFPAALSTGVLVVMVCDGATVVRIVVCDTTMRESARARGPPREWTSERPRVSARDDTLSPRPRDRDIS